MPRTNLVPVRSRAGHIGAGVLAGAVGGLVVVALSSGGTWVPDMFTVLAAIAVVTGPLLLLSIVLARTVPSTVTFLSATTAGFATLILIALVAEILFEPDGGASTGWSDVGISAKNAAVLIALGTLVLLAPWLAVRMVFGRPAPDDQRLCARCNYEYGAPGGACPECGVAREPRVYRSRYALAVSAWLHRWSWTLALVHVLAVFVLLGWRVAHVTRPALAWHRSIVGATPMSPWVATASYGRTPPSTFSAVWLPREGDHNGQGLLLLATIESGRITQARLSIGWWPEVDMLLTSVTSGGAWVEAFLHAQHVQHVLDHGLPPCVVDTMFREADGRGWSPVSPPSSPDRPEYTVDLSACFPPIAKPE